MTESFYFASESVCIGLLQVALHARFYSLVLLPISLPFEHCVLRKRVRSWSSFDKSSRKFEKEKFTTSKQLFLLRKLFTGTFLVRTL